MLFTLLLIISGCNDSATTDFERRYVLVAIPGFKYENYVPLLEHPDPNLRYLAVANLTALGALTIPSAEDESEDDADESQSAVIEKVRSLLQDEIPKVRAIAAHAPSNHGGPYAEADLVGLLGDNADAVRVEALAALAQFETLKESSIDCILDCSIDDNILVRLHALTALGATSPESKRNVIVELLVEAIPQREEAEQLVILESLGALGQDQAEQFVLPHLQSDDPRFVMAAISILTGLESDKIESGILAALEKEVVPDEPLLCLLNDVATSDSLPLAKKLLGSESRETRDCGRQLLLEIETDEALTILLDAYDQLAERSEHNNPPSEELAVIFNDVAELTGELGQLMPDPKTIREHLVTGGAFKQRMALYLLRQNALFDLAVISPEVPDVDFVSELLTLAKDPSSILRAEACETMGHSNDLRVPEALLDALSDPVQEVRTRALHAALRNVEITARFDLLRGIYNRRDEFTPTTWRKNDPGRIARIALEEAVIRLEATWVSRRRLSADLDTENSATTRLIAAALLGQRGIGKEEGAPVLLDFLAHGSTAEKGFAIEAAQNSLTKKHLSQLNEIAEAENDPSKKQQLESLISEL